MQTSNQGAERLLRIGIDALRQGRSKEAQTYFEKLTRTGRANAQILLLLATACRAEDDPAGEESALDLLLEMEPRLLRGHLMKGDCRARAGDDRAAASFYESALMIAGGQQVSSELVLELQRAEKWLGQLKSKSAANREAALAGRGFPRGCRSARFQKSLDILSGARIYVQEPTGYYFPELPQIQFYDTAVFDWVPSVEAAAGEIREELVRLLAAGTEGFRPYLQRDPDTPRLDDNRLLDSGDWSALFFCENGRRSEETIARCPKTWAAVQAAPLPRINNSPTIMFSLLRPGARIAAHTGTHNARLICHLPLVVPPSCGFRVGNEVRAWEEGKILVFDDTIEHEAWNQSNQDRVILIFDIWRPELTQRERHEIEVLFSCSGLN
jgi:hypothetical protein